MKPKIPMIVSSPDASLNSHTNSSQSDTLQTLHQSDTLTKIPASCKIHLDTYPEHRRIFGSRLVAKLPIQKESRGVERS
jgi:hypothetical protein